MKYAHRLSCLMPDRSLPVRGAWVEIILETVASSHHGRRSPCGERGLKYVTLILHFCASAVAPRAGSVG